MVASAIFKTEQNILIYLALKNVIRASILWTTIYHTNNNLVYVQILRRTDLVQEVMILANHCKVFLWMHRQICGRHHPYST